MADALRDFMGRLAELAARRKDGLRPVHRAAREAADARAAAIQAAGPRPVDGITFGSGKPPKASNG